MRIELLNDIKGGMYVEFNTSGTEDYYDHWNNSSSFLYEPVFGVFEGCFNNANSDFNYYGPTLYLAKTLEELLIHLQTSLSMLTNVDSLAAFIEYLDGVSLGLNFLDELDEENAEWRYTYGDILDKLIAINSGLISIVQKCIEQKKVLWVLGI